MATASAAATAAAKSAEAIDRRSQEAPNTNTTKSVTPPYRPTVAWPPATQSTHQAGAQRTKPTSLLGPSTTTSAWASSRPSATAWVWASEVASACNDRQPIHALRSTSKALGTRPTTLGTQAARATAMQDVRAAKSLRCKVLLGAAQVAKGSRPTPRARPSTQEIHPASLAALLRVRRDELRRPAPAGQ